jgi:hypothetical protein
MDWHICFPPGTEVIALPGWREPRVMLAKGGGAARRWRESALYPAFRPAAKIYRHLLRHKARLGLGRARSVAVQRWALGEFLADVLPEARSVVMLIGSPGPARKITAELRDADGSVIGYLKLATTEQAKRRLAHEREILRVLATGFGPIMLKSGAIGETEALLLAPIVGIPLAARSPPASDIIDFARSLPRGAAVALSQHPWIRDMRGICNAPSLEDALADLDHRRWAIVFQHGDFAPWNLLRTTSGAIVALDWEYGAAEGFAYLDLCHFILQVAALVYHRSPGIAAAQAADWLEHRSGLGLTCPTAQALVRLAAFDAWHKGSQDSTPDDAGLQPWRMAIWRSAS